MQRKGANISLKGYDDIFSTEQSRAESQQERVQEIPLSELHPFEGHPFRVVDDEEMMKTAESVRDFGVLTPAIVRPDPDGGYEIVSGHRRHRASELAGKETMPAIVRDLDDDAAIILMVDANLQRESILPSERAFAYKMKLDAIKHQGERTDLTSTQVAQKLSVEKVGEDAGVSKDTIRRYIRLTELIPELLDMVDIEAFSKERNDEYVGRAEEYKAAKSALLEGLGLEHLFDHSHELTPKEKEIWMLFDRVDVAELLARDAFAKGAYMLGAEDREIMLK